MDGGYIATGFTEGVDIAGNEAFLAKFLANGTSEWAIILDFEDSDYNRAYSVKQTSDSGFVVTGYASIGRLFISKVCSNGSFIEWTVTLRGTSGDTCGYSVQQTSDEGFVVGGYTNFDFVGGDILLAKFQPNGTLDWSRVVSKANPFYGLEVQQTADGCYVLVTTICSNGAEICDVLLAKFHSNGSLNWTTMLGGNDWEFGNSVRQTSDYGFIITGFTYSHGGNRDCLVAKFYSNGSLEWSSVLDNGLYEDEGNSIIQASDGGYVITGYTESFGSGGLEDGFLAKIDPNGNANLNEGCQADWTKVDLNFIYSNLTTSQFSPTVVFLSNSSVISTNVFLDVEDIGGSINVGIDCNVYSECYGVYSGFGDSDACSGNGFCTKNGTCECYDNYFGLLCNITQCNGVLSNDSDVCTGHGDCVAYDDCIDCVDEFYGQFCQFLFVPSFDTVFGGFYADIGCSVVQTRSDNGYVIAGSFGGGSSAMLAKFNPDGSFEWARSIGGSDDDYAYSVQEKSGKGFVVAGGTQSFEVCTGDESTNVLLGSFDRDGSLEWSVVFGKDDECDFDDDDVGKSVWQTSDDGFIVTGKTRNGFFEDCVLLAKFSSNGTKEFVTTLRETSGSGSEGNSVQQTKDGGFVLTGRSGSSTLLAKFDSDGSLDWSKSLDFDEWSVGNSIFQTSDDGYVITGYVNSDVGNSLILAKFLSVGDLEWVVSYSGLYEGAEVIQSGHSVQQSIDGGYIVAGDFSDLIMLVKFFPNGTLEWASFYYGGYHVDYETGKYSVQQTFDGGYVIVGTRESGDLFLHKVYDEGIFCGMSDRNSLDYFGSFGYLDGVSVVSSAVVPEDVTSLYSAIFISPDNEKMTSGVSSEVLCSIDYSCFGEVVESKVCNGHGSCVGVDQCYCNSSFYGDICSIFECSGILSNDTENVCSGRGVCTSPEFCVCDEGYEMETSGLCDSWTCFGVRWSEENKVCSGEGVCIGFDACDCKNSYEGGACDTWKCPEIEGFDKGDPKVCSGNGKCVGPSECECSFGFKGDICETNTLYTTIMTPILSLSGVIGLTIFVVVFCCFLCFCCVYCCSVMVVCVLFGFLLTQSSRWKKFSKLKNIDILLQEQLADENTDVAHIRINKRLFEIPHKKIKLLKILGSGGSNSTVYLAMWKNQKVAYKCFKTRDICCSQEIFDEFEHEAEVFSSISHPNVVGFFGCSLDPPRVGIVMEFCEKGECLDYIKKYEVVQGEKYPMNQRFRMLYEICSAMEYLHSRNIVHRDLKCENVLLNGMEQTKLMDFGLAKISDRLSKQVTKGIGTPFYMAPEVSLGGFDGGDMYGEKCDVFSFSIMVFLLITGLNRPYSDEELQSHGIELRVANNPELRLDCTLMEEVLKTDQKYLWIIEETKKCWDHSPENRPSFEELCGMFVDKKKKQEDEDVNSVFSFSEKTEAVGSSSGFRGEEKKGESWEEEMKQEEKNKRLEVKVVELEERLKKRDEEYLECQNSNEKLKKRIKEMGERLKGVEEQMRILQQFKTERENSDLEKLF